MSLALLNEIEHYRRLFMDAGFWRPYVKAALRKVGLPCQRVRSGIPGTFPTFIVDDRFVIKLYGRLFDGEGSYLAELHANRLIQQDPSLPAPALVAKGALEEIGADWTWRFLVFEYLDGVSIGEAWEGLSTESKQDMAQELGGIIRRLHSIPPGRGAGFLPERGDFRGFLDQQRSNCAARLRHAEGVPAWVLKQAQAFLMPADELIGGQPVYLIHADLTRDHLLGRVEAGGWHSLGLIDFGDARLGNILYELVALHLDLFQRDRRLLEAFLKAYGLDACFDFARRAMNMTLLHEFGAEILVDLFQRFPELAQVGSLEALSAEVWE